MTSTRKSSVDLMIVELFLQLLLLLLALLCDCYFDLIKEDIHLGAIIE